jgi:hypothetical protein
MNKKPLFVLLYLVYVLFFFSCKKEEIVSPTKTDLISRKWNFLEEDLDGDGKKAIIYSTVNPVSSSLSINRSSTDYLLFSKDGTLEAYSNIDKKTFTGTWNFVNNENQVQLIYNKTNSILNIDNLTDATSEFSISVLTANNFIAKQYERDVISLGTLAGVVTQTTVKIKYGLKLVAK